jgi:cytochrome c oxidase subunit II
MSSKSKKRVEQLSRRFIGVVAYTVVMIVVLGVAGLLLFRALRPPELAQLDGDVIEVADKPEIRVKVGEPVTVRLTSLDNQHHTDGGGQHQWAVDELGVSVIAQPLGSNTVTFTAEKPGEYTFYCDICCGGRANPTMNGKLIVEA